YDALELMEKNKIDLFLVDIMMEGMDGLELTQKIREVSNAPIIILSAKSELNDKVMGLNLGDDDYITKPFDAVELLARIKSCLRRLELSKDNSLNGNVFSAGRLTINDDKKEVLIDGEEIKLTPYEYGIILLLLKNKGIVFTSEEIYENVWEAPPYDVKKIVSVHISRLREKVEINPRRPDLIKSVYGMGYKIEDI
ncbi:MAG: response regulator transcription factor, partial [Finegoldia magna]|nr:response regulator transcription factor [Finegoldia magna]